MERFTAMLSPLKVQK